MIDPEYTIYNQSAVLPFRLNNDDVEILLIRNRSDKRWIIPKGIIEPGMSAEESASQEALEEAGITGKVLEGKVGEYQYEKWGGTCHVKVFLMRVENVLDDWLESFRKRKWVKREDAIDLITDNAVKKIIRNAHIPSAPNLK